MARLVQSVFVLVVSLLFSEALTAPTDGLSAATRRFEASWNAKGIKSNGLKHALFRYPCVGEIKGLSLKKSGQKGSILLQVPSTAVLSLNDRDKSPVQGMSRELWTSLKITTRLSLLLLTEFLKGDASQHKEYIDTLKEEKLLTPIRWSPQTLSALRESYPSLSLACEKQRKDYNQLHDMLTSGPSPPFSPSAVPFELFLWAMEAVRSRAFQGLGGSGDGFGGFFAPIVAVALVALAFFFDRTNLGGDGLVVPVGLATGAMLVLLPSLVRSQQGNCALLPAIDSCNHDSVNFSGDVIYDPVASAYQLRECGNSDRGEDKNKDDAQGSELNISYGQRSNDELLQYFGFVEVGNPHDMAAVAVPSLGTNAALSFAIVNRKGRESWSVPPGISDEQLRSLLQNQADMLGRAVERLVAAASPRSGAEGAAEAREWCLLVEFLKQKRSVISDAANTA